MAAEKNAKYRQEIQMVSTCILTLGQFLAWRPFGILVATLPVACTEDVALLAKPTSGCTTSLWP